MSTNSAPTDLITAALAQVCIQFGVNEDTDEHREAVERAAQIAAKSLGLAQMEVKPRRAVLTAEKVKLIRELYAEGKGGVTQAELVERFGVTNSTISRVLNNKMWTHV